jgi:predicted pyridoxine 5'-phosphate oxidase superfamily flavin-nucleotide-binding protein
MKCFRRYKMAKMTIELKKAWENREGPIVLTTVDQEGIPNAIYATCVSMYDDETLVVADNYFLKTRENILLGSRASLLFITTEGNSYQVKGDVQYLTSGEIYENMKSWNPTRHPGHAAVAIKVRQVFSGSKQLI